MADIIPFEDRKTKKIRQEAQSLIDALMESPDDMTDEQFRIVSDKWRDHKEHMERNGGSEMEDMEKLFTPEQAAEYLQISPKTVRAYLREKKLKGVKLGKEWRIKQSALKEFVDNLKGQE